MEINKVVKNIGEDFKLTINWATGSMIVGLLTAAITLYVYNKNLGDEIVDLKDNNKQLTTTISQLGNTINSLNETVSDLKGQQSVMSNAVNLFLSYPPGETDYRLQQLETRVFGTTQKTPRQTFNGNKPPTN